MAVALAVQEFGSGPPVLILHGLFGIGRQLGRRGRAPWASASASSRSICATMARRRGRERMDYPALAEDVADFMAARGLRSAAIIGHSMGGKVGMALALTAPQSVERLLTVDIAPVARTATHVAYGEAMRSLDLRGVSRRGAADELLKPHIADDAVRMFLLQNLVPGPDGLRWRINLDVILQEMAALSGFPEVPPRTNYPGPVLVVRGALSDYIEPGDLAVYAGLFPAYRLVTIAGAGHWLHAEQQAAFLAAVTPFLAGGSSGSGMGMPDLDRIARIIRDTAATQIAAAVSRARRKRYPREEPRRSRHASPISRSEQRLILELEAAMPGTVALGEESVAADPTRLDLLAGETPVWVIDPIDGTGNFAKGVARFAVIIAYVARGVTQAGWIYDPTSDVDGDGAARRRRVERRTALAGIIARQGPIAGRLGLRAHAGGLPRRQRARR